MFVSQYSVMSSRTSSLVEQTFELAVVVVIYPGRKPHRRVRQGVADRLRPRSHDCAVRPVLLVERIERVERRAFLLGKSRRRRPAAGEHRGHIGRYRRRQVDVDAEQSCRRLARHRAGDGGAPVATLGDVAGVAEALHQLRPGAGDALRIPARASRLAREAVTGHRRNYQVESVRCARAVRGGISQWIDDLQLLDDRAGPAVRDDERQRIFMFRTNMNEMNVEPVDLGDELRQGVEPRLRLSPIVAGAPVAHQLLNFSSRTPCDRSLTVSRSGHRVAPMRRRRSSSADFWNVDTEGTNCVAFFRQRHVRGKQARTTPWQRRQLRSDASCV